MPANAINTAAQSKFVSLSFRKYLPPNDVNTGFVQNIIVASENDI